MLDRVRRQRCRAAPLVGHVGQSQASGCPVALAAAGGGGGRCSEGPHTLNRYFIFRHNLLNFWSNSVYVHLSLLLSDSVYFIECWSYKTCLILLCVQWHNLNCSEWQETKKHPIVTIILIKDNLIMQNEIKSTTHFCIYLMMCPFDIYFRSPLPSHQFPWLKSSSLFFPHRIFKLVYENLDISLAEACVFVSSTKSQLYFNFKCLAFYDWFLNCFGVDSMPVWVYVC